MADELDQRGHLNVLIREAIRQGLSPEKAVYASTFAPAQRMRLYDRGALSGGAIATTYAHDSHNLLVIGYSPEEIVCTANTVIASHGGIAVVEGNTLRASLPLPVAGLMAEE